MIINRKSSVEEHAVQVTPLRVAPHVGFAAFWPQLGVGLLLCLAWLAVVLQAALELPTFAASWLTYVGLLIAPGYLVGDLFVRRLDLDWLERMALAFPVGVAVLAVPGLAALLQHWRVQDLAQAWVWCSGAIVAVWALSWLHNLPQKRAPRAAWAWDERLLLALLAGAFLILLPTLNQHKIDGDTLAVGSFTADAMAGLPLNQVEPLFGTELGPGVRMAFNQSLPMFYLWSHWSGVEAMLLMGSATRAMLALWALLATYMLGKAAGAGLGGSVDGRRVGLLAVAVQLLIYVAAPFLRGDNVSLFFFERIAADKFLVPVTMLPVAFALAIRFVRQGEWQVWAAGLLVAFAVSAIHPLVAAMLALGLGAFGGLHWLLRLRERVTYKRVGALAALVVVVMALPLAQLALSRGEDPLASSYPSTLAGWEVSHRWIPVLPYFYLPTLDVHGPLPDLSQLEAEEALTATDPFLVWRFAVNMDRRRLVLFDLDRYISDPNIFLEPPYVLALLMLPFFLWRLRSSLGVQFVVATTAALLLVMYNPLFTPLLGGLVMPWILWRFVWMFPYAIILALGLVLLWNWLAAVMTGVEPRLLRGWGARPSASRMHQVAVTRARRIQRYAPLIVVALIALIATPAGIRNLNTLNERAGFPYFYPQPQALLQRLDAETQANGPGTVMADADLSVTIPAYVAQANIVAHRIPTTSEVFPAQRQTEALQRLIDQDAFYRSRYLTSAAVAILKEYDTRYVVAGGGSNLDVQLRLMPGWFTPIFADESYVLYQVGEISAQARIIQANSALAERRWSEAESLYRAELARDPAFSAAWVGLAEIAHARGEFAQAIGHLEQAQDALETRSTLAVDPTTTAGELAAVHYRLGQVLGDVGRLTASTAAYAAAAELAPSAARFHIAHGDACLRLAQVSCAADSFRTAVAQQNLPDAAAYTVTLADMWRQRGYLDEAIPLYEMAAGHSPDYSRPAQDGAGTPWLRGLVFGGAQSSRIQQLILVGAYQEAGRFAEAEALLQLIRGEEPWSPDVWQLTAELHAAQGEVGAALEAYARAIWFLDVTGRESVATRLALVSTLLQPNTPGARSGDAQEQLDWIFQLEPGNALAYSLQGDLHDRLFRAQAAREAYETAFRLNPTSVAVYFALSDQYRRLGGTQSDIAELLQAALRANPNEATLALALGDQLRRRGEMIPATEAYLNALDLFERRSTPGRLNPRITGGSRAYAYVQLAGVHEELGQIAQAMNFYSAAVASAPDAAWAQVAHGDALRRQNHPDLAEEAYRTALGVDSAFVPAYLSLADLQMARGELDAASALRSDALEIAFDQLGELETRADAAASLGDGQAIEAAFSSDQFDAGQFDLNQALGADAALAERVLQHMQAADMDMPVEEGSTTLNLLARLVQTPAQVDMLFDVYARVLERGAREGWYPTALAQYHKGLGDLYLVRNRPQEAQAAYAEAIALDEGWLQARLGLVNALSSGEQTDAAIAELETLLEGEPGLPQARVALALQYANAGRTEDAMALLTQTLEAAPGDVQAQVALAQLYQDQGDWDAAERIYQRAIDMASGTVEARTAYASLLLAQGRDDVAADVLHSAYELDQTDLTVHLLSSVLAQRRGDPQAAADWLARAARWSDLAGANLVAIADLYGRFGLNQDGLRFLDYATALQPEQIDLILRKARTLRTLGQYNDALATLLAAANLDLEDARLNAELAEVYLAQGRRQAALVAYRQATVLDPAQEDYWLRLAELLTLQGDNEQAETVLRQALRQMPQASAIYSALAELLLRLARTDEAEVLLEAALAATPEPDSTLLVGKGVLLEAQALRSLGPSDSAEQWYLDALARADDTPELHAALADHYLRRSQLDKAQDHYETALSLAPDRARYHMGLGNVYLARAANLSGEQAALRLGEAEAQLLRAIRLEPGLLDAHYLLIDLYSNQRNWDAARGIFVQAKRIAPANGEVHVRYAAFLLERGETELGMDLLGNAESVAPNARTLVARAGVYAKLRRTDMAIKDLQQAIAWEPGYVDAHIALGDVLRDFGNNQAASEAYRNAIRLNPSLGFGRLRVTRAR